jgi:hypothetical protein
MDAICRQSLVVGFFFAQIFHCLDRARDVQGPLHVCLA